MKSECKFNVEHSFQTIHLSPKTQITIYTHRRTDDMKIPDTVQYQVITLQKLSEHCFYLTQRVHKHTIQQIDIYYWQNILSHADISSEVWEYFWNDGQVHHDPEMYIHDLYTDISWSVISWWEGTTNLLWTHFSTHSHNIHGTKYEIPHQWEYKTFTWHKCLNKNLSTRNKKWLKCI